MVLAILYWSKLEQCIVPHFLLCACSSCKSFAFCCSLLSFSQPKAKHFFLSLANISMSSKGLFTPCSREKTSLKSLSNRNGCKLLHSWISLYPIQECAKYCYLKNPEKGHDRAGLCIFHKIVLVFCCLFPDGPPKKRARP